MSNPYPHPILAREGWPFILCSVCLSVILSFVLGLWSLPFWLIIPGSSYWNVGYGLSKGDIQEDAEGVETLRTLGENMAWLLKKLKG